MSLDAQNCVAIDGIHRDVKMDREFTGIIKEKFLQFGF